MSIDILLYETGSGGDLEVLNNDLVVVETLFQQVYLALFGGNVEQNTPEVREDDEELFDYWANTLFFEQEPNRQFNSNTERVLNNVVLNTNGRLQIEQAVNTDLDYLRNISNFTVNVSIPNEYSVSISVTLTQPDDTEDKIIQFIWNNARQELIIERQI